MEKLNYEIFRDDINIPYLREVEYNECWLHFHRNMEMLYVVDGELEGNIHSTNTVMVGKNGVVNGDIFAQRVIVGGISKGTVDSECIEILPEGKIEGTIICNELYIEKKGVFVGESKIKSKSYDSE